MTDEEIGLLLYLETRAVDHGGLICDQQMNDFDRRTVDAWKKSGFVEAGRVALPIPKIPRGTVSTWVRLSEEALTRAHKERRLRAERMWKDRNWMSTEEKRNLKEDDEPNEERD